MGDDKVVLGLSGGVDSTVAAVLLNRAIGSNLTCIFVDNGLLRKNEFEGVLDSYKDMGLNVIGVDAKEYFYERLAGVTEPERKRKIIGAGFIEGALFACLLIVATIIVFSRLERMIISRARNINLYLEFAHMDDLGSLISLIKAQDIRIFDVEMKKPSKDKSYPSAVFSIRLPKRMQHTALMATLAGVECVRAIEEL